MTTKTIKQLKLLFKLLFYSFAIMACSENDSPGNIDNDISQEETEPEEETELLEETGAEILNGYKAMNYSNSKYDYSLPLRLYIPEDYEEGDKYPLVIFLHGAGRRGSDNIKQINEMAGAKLFVKQEVQLQNPSFVLAPQCPVGASWLGSSLSGENRPVSFDDVNPSTPHLLLMDLLNYLPDQYGIDSSRIYLTGQSMGGAGTWYAALSHPEKFAAIAPVCGWSFPSAVSVIADLPVWAFHGALDQTIPVEASRDMVNALETVGNTEVKYTEYPNVGHESWYKAYKDDIDNNGEVDLAEWIFLQERQ